MLWHRPSRARILAATLAAGLAGASVGISPAAVPLFASASSAGTSAASTSLALPAPAGTAAGQALVAVVAARHDAGVSAPPGWLEVVRTTCLGNNDVALTQAVFVRVAAAGDPAAHTFALPAAAGAAGAIAAYGGVDRDDPVLASTSQVRRNSRLVTAPSLTAPAGALVLGAFSHSGRATVSAPDGTTVRAAAAGTPDVRLLVADELREAAGATGDRAAFSTQTNACAVGQLVALRPAPDPPLGTGPPEVTGVAQEGHVLSVSTGSWTGSPTAFAYRWQRGAGESWSDVDGATGAEYAVGAADVGERLRAVVTASNSGGSGTAASAATGPVLPAPPVSTSPPTVAGEAVELGALTADPGAWTGAPAFAFAWERSADGASWEPIEGAAEPEYVAGSADVGSFLRVAVTASNPGGAATAWSEPSARVEPAGPPTLLQPPTISGWQQEGELLTATAGTWSGSPTSLAHLWQRSENGSSWTDLGGGAAHVLGPDDVGRLVRVVVTAANAAGPASAASEPVGPIGPAVPPANVALPTIVGIAAAGVPLQATEGVWVNAPRELSFRWLRSPDGGASWEPIADAVGRTYVPLLGDVGLLLAVEVTAANANGSAAATSAPAGPVGAPPPESVALPVVSGDAIEGSTLAVTQGEWTNAPTGFAYAWQRCDASGCTEIRWEIEPEYTLRRVDVGFAVRALVTASNPGGAATAVSAPTPVVLAHAPVSQGAPVLSGVAAAGETLSVSNGAWYSATTVAFGYRWERSLDGGSTWSQIAGAAAPTLVLQPGDVGSVVRAVVTATNEGGATEAASDATATVTPPGAPTVLALPAVSGTVQDRGRLTALTGTWSGSPTFTYAWQRSADGGATWTDVQRATSFRYTAGAADVGRQLRVLVTGRNDHGSVTVATESWLIHPAGGGAIHLANATLYCDGPIDVELVRVTIVDGFGRDAIRFDDCSGRIGRVEIVTNGIDGLKVRNNAPVAHDLTIEGGYVRCTGHPDGAHQDGIQVLGGARVTFRNLVIWCPSEAEFGLGVNSNALIGIGGAGASTPTDIVIEDSVMGPGTTNGVLVANAIRAGIRRSVACPDRTPTGGPVLLDPSVVDGIDLDNEKPDLDDPRCSSFEAALAWVEG